MRPVQIEQDHCHLWQIQQQDQHPCVDEFPDAFGAPVGFVHFFQEICLLELDSLSGIYFAVYVAVHAIAGDQVVRFVQIIDREVNDMAQYPGACKSQKKP